MSHSAAPPRPAPSGQEGGAALSEAYYEPMDSMPLSFFRNFPDSIRA